MRKYYFLGKTRQNVNGRQTRSNGLTYKKIATTTTPTQHQQQQQQHCGKTRQSKDVSCDHVVICVKIHLCTDCICHIGLVKTFNLSSGFIKMCIRAKHFVDQPKVNPSIQSYLFFSWVKIFYLPFSLIVITLLVHITETGICLTCKNKVDRIDSRIYTQQRQRV